MDHKGLSRLAVLLLLVALAGCGLANHSIAMAPTPIYTTSVLLSPAPHAQVRTIQFRPDSYECTATAHVRPDLKNVRCYGTLTLQLGPSHQYGRWTQTYAAIRQCVARLTPAQLHAGCLHSIETCANPKNGACAPDWTSQTSIEFRTNGKQVKKEWITCGGFTAHWFDYRLRYCGAAREIVPWRRGWISVGDDYELRIPNVIQMSTEERFDLRPDGGLLFENCC